MVASILDVVSAGRAGAPPVRVVVADDHPFFRDGVARGLTQSGRIEVVAAVGDGREALEAIRRDEPDVAIVDYEMPDIDGLGVVRAAVRDGLATRVLLHDACRDPGACQEGGRGEDDAAGAGGAGGVWVAVMIGPFEWPGAVAPMPLRCPVRAAQTVDRSPHTSDERGVGRSGDTAVSGDVDRCRGTTPVAGVARIGATTSGGGPGSR